MCDSDDSMPAYVFVFVVIAVFVGTLLLMFGTALAALDHVLSLIGLIMIVLGIIAYTAAAVRALTYNPGR